MSSVASRYARIGFRELIHEHALAVEVEEIKRGGIRLREMSDRSLGAAVFLGRGIDRRVLLIEQISQGARFWSLPKGHAEPSDVDDVATATRELLEETGVDITGYIIPGIWCGSSYSYCGTPHVTQVVAANDGVVADEKVVFHKSVLYALADLGASSVSLPKLTLQTAEVADAEFLPIDIAVERLRHENDRLVLRELAARHAQLC
jgi:8-oxo-dGTP pyrophosphatase MutT (NUDIX family)